MTLLDSAPYDERRAKRKRTLIIIAVVVVIVGLVSWIYYPRYAARRTINQFMEALVHKNYQEAYYVWKADPKLYPMDAFMQDWGPTSKWGTITKYKIDQLGLPPPAGAGSTSGLVALVEINGIASDEARIWIQNGTRELGFYQF